MAQGPIQSFPVDFCSESTPDFSSDFWVVIGFLLWRGIPTSCICFELKHQFLFQKKKKKESADPLQGPCDEALNRVRGHRSQPDQAVDRRPAATPARSPSSSEKEASGGPRPPLDGCARQTTTQTTGVIGTMIWADQVWHDSLFCPTPCDARQEQPQASVPSIPGMAHPPP